MSLRGRYIIDRIKYTLAGKLRLPVPPYGDPSYWDKSYMGFGPTDVFEWGDVSFSDLSKYEFVSIDWESLSTKPSVGQKETTTLGETIAIESHAKSDEPILMLGCGNSRLGEEMIQNGWRGPIIQVDVSSRIIESMSHRCSTLISDGHMNFIQDDATELSAFRNEMIHACLDKGLIDAVSCADEYEQCSSILNSVNRVLKPGGIFVFLSYSRPEFLLPKIAFSRDWNQTNWESIQVQELPKILLYRFQKTTKQYSSKRKARRK